MTTRLTIRLAETKTTIPLTLSLSFFSFAFAILREGNMKRTLLNCHRRPLAAAMHVGPHIGILHGVAHMSNCSIFYGECEPSSAMRCKASTSAL